MCTTFWQFFDEASDGSARFVLAFNRDEYFGRATAGFHEWESQPSVCAPRDLEPEHPAEQGAWIGVNRRGLLALLTNFLEPNPEIGSVSRGALVRGLLVHPPATPGGHAVAAQSNREIVREYASAVFAERAQYSGFNLVLFDLAADGEVWYVTNRGSSGGAVRCLPRARPAGLSNSTIDRPWAKVDRGLQAFAAATAGGPPVSAHTVDALMRLMADTGPFSAERPPRQPSDLDHCIFVPRTRDPAKGLQSSAFGTRSTEVLLLRGRELTIVEQCHDADGADPKTIRFLLDIPLS
ncbi:Transport and Golgi organization protein 2 [Coemansia nantahalensis]|uniref:Transport and Golgi organization protein 2 n=1 Tax=Coemansia nantahalensis TaxID=2789366 RepID=A0ACC1K7C9_9FUNG|nr:Transport and Golgi organization protein 2 [Coemansia nantahalensis]